MQSEVVKFLIVAKAICGIVLQEPFLNMIVEQHVSRSQLLIILPALFKELNNPPHDVLDLSKPALPSLTSSWLRHCYPEEQILAITSYVDNCDRTAMRNTVLGMLKADAVCLARQRGPEYGFGGDGNIDHPQHVLNQLPVGKEGSLDEVAADNLESEHHFGEFTQQLQKIGSQHTKHVSECSTISSSSDLAFRDHNWKTRQFKKVFDEMQNCKNKFEGEQEQLRKQNIEVENLVDILEDGRRRAGQLEKMKLHGGPITNQKDLDSILDNFEGWGDFKEKSVKSKKLKSILRQEIIYGRDNFFTTVKKTNNPLFKVNNLSIKDMVQNLRVLHGEFGENITADMEDVRAALATLDSNQHEKNTDIVAEQDVQAVEVETFKKEETILFQTADKLGIGVVEEVHPDKLWVTPMESAKRKNLRSSAGDSRVSELWKYPDQLELLEVTLEEVLPVRPILELDGTRSKNSCVIFRLLNDDILEKFLTSKQ